MNFAISSMGRCGTLSLAQLLKSNKSGVIVHHEPKGQKFYQNSDTDEVSKRFVNNYGEVNSFLRRVLIELEVDKKAVIVRHPHKILLSSVNWRPSHLDNLDWFIGHLNEALMNLDKCIESGIRHIRFEHMISNCDCLKNLINFLELDCKYVLPVTHNSKGRIKTTDELDCDVKCFDWFVSKYYSYPDTCFCGR